MKKLSVLFIILLVSSIVITACSGTTTTPAVTTAPAVTTTAATTAPQTTTAAPKPATSTPATSVPATSAPPATTAPATGQPQYGATLRYISATGPGAPIGAPWLANGTSSFAMQFVEDFLISGKSDGSLAPNLATSWDIVSDPANPSITLHLAKGVTFQDGSVFNAQAVKWNMDMAMAPGSTLLGSVANWKSVQVIDDSTIRFNLKVFQNNAINTFATSTGFIVSPTAYQKNGADWMNYNMVGTAAFSQPANGFQRDVALNLVKNPNYRDPKKPYLNGITLLYVSDAMTSEALFRSGGGDILQSGSDLTTSRFRASGAKIVASQVPGATNIWPDSANADSPWSNLKVRQAAEYAIDKKSLASTFGYGDWTPAYQSNVSISPAYDPKLESQYRIYDVAKAKQLLTDAGYPNGFKTTIYNSPFGANPDISTTLQAMWKAVGINADIQNPQAGAFSAMLTGTWHNGVLFGPGAGAANPLTGWSLTYAPGSSWFKSMKRPADVADLFASALASSTLDPALLQKVEDSIYNDDTIIPMWTSPTYWVISDKVMDSGLGTRDLFAWFEPQNTWLSK
jgi:peptide/nickel transport system substrate-binding protein